MKIQRGKRYIVTGGTGFLGVSLVARIISQGGIARVMARNEGKLFTLKALHGSRVEIFPGDISNCFSVQQLLNCEYEGIFHLAAFKHVPLAEQFSFECISANVDGSDNILSIGAETGAKFIIGISTDKAAQVSGVYGATKLLMEKQFQQIETLYPQTKFRVVRYGNVLYSTGSVLCIWKDKLIDGLPIIITDGEATRFFWTKEQAIDLIFECLDQSINAKPWVPKMKAMSMGALLDAMILKYSKNPEQVEITHIGLQKGENKHERILEDGPYSNEVELFTIPEIQKLI